MQCYQKDKRIFFVIFSFFAVFFTSSLSLAQTPTIEEILNLPEEKIDIAYAAFVISKGVNPNFDINKYLKQIDEVADSLREKIDKPTIFHKQGSPGRAIQVINNYLFMETGFVSVENEWRTFFLNEVIDEKKGSCLGLSIFYLCLAQKLNLPVYLVAAPKHYFVRYDNGEFKENIETTMQGLDLPDSYYWRAYHISPESIKKGVYLKNLSKKETIARLLAARGSIFAEKGKNNKALSDFSLAMKFSRNNPEILFNKAIVYCKGKQWNKAINLLDRVILLDPRFAEAYRTRGVAYALKGKTNKAIENYNQAIKLDPNNASAYALRGQAYKKIGKLEKAKKDFDKFVKLKKAMRENEQQ